MMEIAYQLEPDGGFTAGDRESRVTAYAFPTSTHAVAAKKNPKKTALEMVRSEMESRHMGGVADAIAKDSDNRNWSRLGELL